MSAILLTETVAMLRAAFTRVEAQEVRAYGGEFSSAEMDTTAYTCPAILVTVLGWKPEPQSRRLGGRDVRSVRMAAFVAAKHAKREARMAIAMTLAERLSIVLRQWSPNVPSLPMQLGPLEAEPTVENLYGRAIDAKGQALWLVTWDQCVKPLVPLDQLYDLLAVEIDDTTRQGATAAPAPGPAPAALSVSEDVQFAPLPPVT